MVIAATVHALFPGSEIERKTAHNSLYLNSLYLPRRWRACTQRRCVTVGHTWSGNMCVPREKVSRWNISLKWRLMSDSGIWKQQQMKQRRRVFRYPLWKDGIWLVVGSLHVLSPGPRVFHDEVYLVSALFYCKVLLYMFWGISITY